MTLRVNRERLGQNLEALSQIGKSPRGGINRALGSEAEREARRWLCGYWETHLHKTAAPDAAANLWVVRPGTACKAKIAFGSHHDTVTEGGKFDGALGVLLATEILETLEETHTPTRHPFALVSFTGEEPNPFHVSTLGSKVLSGRLHRADLEHLENAQTHAPFSETLAALGGDLQKIDEALLDPHDVCAFLECHIEQGRRLLDKNLPLAAVGKITGIYREDITVHGEANHAGTTVMRDRHDALLAACALNLAFERALRAVDRDDVTGTVGQLLVFPNSVNIIPGAVVLTLEIRTCDEAILETLREAVTRAAAAIEAQRGVQIERQVNLNQAPAPMSPVLQDALLQAFSDFGQPPCTLTSMAGHDAANVARRTRAGMLFVRSNGKSHCAGEDASLDDIELAGNAMLQALLRLDQELE